MKVLKTLLLSGLSICLFDCSMVTYDATFETAIASTVPVAESVNSNNQFNDDHFYSDKLDLVIVLDTSLKSKKVLAHNIFGSDFIKQFEDYDWRLAWTDSSVDKKLIEDKKESSSKCSRSGPIFFALGVWVTSPVLGTLGAESMIECVASLKFSKSPKGNNGEFLAFEDNRKAIKDYYLTKETHNYASIFEQTMNSTNSVLKRKYDAPVFKKYEPYPIAATLLSLVNSNKEKSFFRKDSQVVYVVVSLKDIDGDIDGKKLQTSLEDHLQLKRFQFIPVSIPAYDDDCKKKLESQGLSVESGTKLDRLARGFDNKSVSICSSNLGLELAEEIKKHIYPENLL